MRILHTVENYAPDRNGMQEVVRQLSERLAKKGHEVTIGTACHPDRKDEVMNGVRIESFAMAGNMVEGYRGSSAERERYQRFLTDAGFDIVTNFAAQQWATDLALPILGDIKAKKIFVSTGFSALHLKKYRDYFARMPEWMRCYDMNVLLSETYRDARFAEEHGIVNRLMIPNGAAEEEFLPDDPASIREELGINAETFFVLSVGSHTGKKGHEEAIRIFDVARISDAALVIIGDSFDQVTPRDMRDRMKTGARILYKMIRNECPVFCRRAARSLNESAPWRRDAKRLLLLDLPRAVTVRAFLAADLFLFPSRVECSPIVLFEAAASRTPFLSTDVGNAVEIARWTGGGRILPTNKDADGYSHADIEGGARMLEDLWRDADLRRGLAEAGHAAWRGRFTWEKIANRYEALYAGIHAGKGDQR